MGRPAKYPVHLEDAEREFLKKVRRSHKRCSTVKKRAEIILALDLSQLHPLSRDECAKKCKVSVATVTNTARLYSVGGLDLLLCVKRNPNSDSSNQKFFGEEQARIIAHACSDAPAGRARWTVRLLAEELTVVLENSISPSTVSRILQSNELKPHLSEYWCIPEQSSGDFAAHMEDILAVYARPEDPRFPVWCLDEKPYQLLGEVREPIPMKPGSVKKVDAEYVRNGHVAIFVMINPNTGEIHQSVHEHRTAEDFALEVQWLVDHAGRDAEKVVLVMDNLNTHKIGSIYQTFPPEVAFKIVQKLEIHYTPKHGSWLDIAEIGINIVTKQCLGNRYSTIEELRTCLDEWERRRNQSSIKIDWKFTSEAAREKLKTLYPTISSE